jgi:NAD(P) transhydrogenase subunit alpha
MTVVVGVLEETRRGERRVALDPDATAQLVRAGSRVLIQAGAGAAAGFPDALYVAAGAAVASRADVVAGCAALVVVGPPPPAVVDGLQARQVLIGLLDPLHELDLVRALAAKGVTAVAFELLPRTLSRVQAMDALSSQASAAGYRAAIVAAERFGRYLPMMITASGTARPAAALVIGTGVAGLQAIATLRRLGAVVTGYDVRPDSRGEVESLGARFQTSSVAAGAAAGGYARAMSPAEQAAQQEELTASLVGFDIIVTTAKVPGRTPPVLVSRTALAGLKAGSVCIDMAAGGLGGNVAGSIDGEDHRTPGGVVVVGAGDLATDLPTSSSQMYARNVSAVLSALVVDGAVTIDLADEVQARIVVCTGGEVTNAAVRAALHPDAPPVDPAPTSTAPSLEVRAA